MCNRYKADRRKYEAWARTRGLWTPTDDEEWSETKIEIFPDRLAPVITKGSGGVWEETIMRWGLPGPAKFGAAPVTNVRNLKSAHWRGLLSVQHRCLVPFTSFSEYEDASPKGKKALRWFDPTGADFAMFAGIWRTWTGLRGTKAEQAIWGAREHRVFSFLTTEPNDLVRPIHAKAMPVILTNEAEWRHWLTAPPGEVEAIQARPLADDALRLWPHEAQPPT